MDYSGKYNSRMEWPDYSDDYIFRKAIRERDIQFTGKDLYLMNLRVKGLTIDILDHDVLQRIPLEEVICEVGKRWPSSRYTTKRFRSRLLGRACILGRVDILKHYYTLENGRPKVLTRYFLSLAEKYEQDDVIDWIEENVL